MLYESQKESGAYYTPERVAATLVSWAVHSDSDRLLDPSCGDGRFIAQHKKTVGIEQDPIAAHRAISQAPWALVHEGDFFAWATATNERFECAAGNPPFIRYQTFKGDARATALELCARLGANFSGLTSSWAPFLVAVASLLKPGGRMAFVVPAEIGHAPYAAPLIEYLIEHFELVQVVAIRDKLFPYLSEDCWLLYAADFGARTSVIDLTVRDCFAATQTPPRSTLRVPVAEWRRVWNRRLRPYLISDPARALYREAAAHPRSFRLGDIANVEIGYVSGANEFFHLRPSDAKRWKIPRKFLHASVRNGRALQAGKITPTTVAAWVKADEPVLLLRISKDEKVPATVQRYLDSEAGRDARDAYKCRTRDPWYVVPDVQIPDFFLSYMSGLEPNLVRNGAGCTATNSVHVVRLRTTTMPARFQDGWESPLSRLSCELEGHPLGGGMLKLEPREASRIVIGARELYTEKNRTIIADAIESMRTWRHYAT